MIVEKLTGLANDALKNPKKYNGFMGISIRNYFFTKETMKRYFQWCSENFNQFIIILMDDPDQYNLMVFKELDKKTALKKAREISDYTKKAFMKTLRGLGVTNISIVQFRDFCSDRDYKKLSALIKKFVRNNSVFRDSMFTLMEMIVGKKLNDFSQLKKLSTPKLTDIKKILFRYTVEEIVPLLYFTEKGYSIEIDPTPEFLPKKLLYEGKFPEFFRQIPLSKRGHIFAHPKSTYYGDTIE